MPLIEFTQYLRPDGRKNPVSIDRPGPVYRKAKDIVRAGYRLECEVLNDETTVSLTITNDRDGDVACELVPNGTEVPNAVDRLIEAFRLPEAA